MRLKMFDHDHPTVAASECVKGQVLVALGKYDTASVLLERAMVTMRVALGPRHVHVARCLVGMGQALQGKGLPREAYKQLSLGLDIVREAHGR